MYSRFIIIIYFMLLIIGCKHSVNESSETVFNWNKAKEYQRQERYELAQQYYLLALANAKDPESQKTLMQELKSIERMIQTMR